MTTDSQEIKDGSDKAQISPLNERQRRVLKEVCDAFISTGIPVGSRTISRFGGVAYSPATIRNEMADLESMGYLFSPHTSAGRIPTEKGFRFYSRFLIEFERVSQIEETLMGLLAEKFEQQNLEQDDVLRSAIRFACEKTRLPGIAIIPQKSSNRLQSIKLFRILEDKAMLVLVDECDHITDHLICIPSDTTDEALQILNHYLETQLCMKQSIENEANFLRKSHGFLVKYNNLLSQITARIKAAVQNNISDDFFLEGFMNFFEQPEFKDPEKMRTMLSLLDQKEVLLSLLAKSLENGDEIMVNIGSDAGLSVSDLSVVTARYCGPNQSFGRIGLIGPLRMDYGRVVATLTRISKALSDLFMFPDRKGLKGILESK